MSPEQQFTFYYVLPAILSLAISQSLVLHCEKDTKPKSAIKTKVLALLFSLFPGFNLLFLFIVTVVTFFHVYDKLD